MFTTICRRDTSATCRNSSRKRSTDPSHSAIHASPFFAALCIQTPGQTIKPAGLKTQQVWMERKNTDSGVDLKAIRLFCMAPALAAMLAAASVQAQEPASARPPSREGTVSSGQDGISGTDSVALA